jgi:hypothetical protein
MRLALSALPAGLWSKKQTLDSHCTASCHMCAAQSDPYITLFLCHFCADARLLQQVQHTAEHGWGPPRIVPFGPLRLHPAAQVLHYGTCCFEGMKAYLGPEGQGLLFRWGRQAAVGGCIIS